MKTIRITREQIEKALGSKARCQTCVDAGAWHIPESFEIDVEEENEMCQSHEKF